MGISLPSCHLGNLQFEYLHVLFGHQNPISKATEMFQIQATLDNQDTKIKVKIQIMAPSFSFPS